MGYELIEIVAAAIMLIYLWLEYKASIWLWPVGVVIPFSISISILLISSMPTWGSTSTTSWQALTAGSGGGKASLPSNGKAFDPVKRQSWERPYGILPRLTGRNCWLFLCVIRPDRMGADPVYRQPCASRRCVYDGAQHRGHVDARAEIY